MKIDMKHKDAINFAFRRCFCCTAKHLFHDYIRRGVGATRREFLMSLLCLPVGAFLFYLATDPSSKSVPWSITTPIFQVAVVAIPWFGG